MNGPMPVMPGMFGHAGIVTVRPNVANMHIIRLDSEVGEPKEYRQVFETLATASESDCVFMELNTPGGQVHSMLQIVQAIRDCKAKVVANVHYAASAGSVIALACDDIQINQHAVMMVHAPSWCQYGKFHEQLTYADFQSKVIPGVFFDVYSTFLSDQEIRQVLGGADMWLTAPEISARLKKWVPMRKRDKAQKEKADKKAKKEAK